MYQLDCFHDACVNFSKRFAGWLGMVLIHGATVPVSLRAIFGTATALPPLEMVLMVWGGLTLFLLNAVANRNTLYIVSNGVGFALQSVLLAIIVFGR